MVNFFFLSFCQKDSLLIFVAEHVVVFCLFTLSDSEYDGITFACDCCNVVDFFPIHSLIAIGLWMYRDAD
jgi:hypothetical protein